VVSTARNCAVSFVDSEGVTHSVEVSAASLYEAVVLAMAEFARLGFAKITPGRATRLRVEVKSPAVTHELSVRKVTAWLEGIGKSPAEQVLKTRLKEILSKANVLP
jgi:hypothetical protein